MVRHCYKIKSKENGELEPWTGMFKNKDLALKWFNRYGVNHVSQGHEIVLTECERNKSIIFLNKKRITNEDDILYVVKLPFLNQKYKFKSGVDMCDEDVITLFFEKFVSKRLEMKLKVKTINKLN